MKERCPKTGRHQAMAKDMTTIKPFSQGKLDSLCGLYCVVNAVRLAALPKQTIGRAKSKALIDAIARALGPKLAKIFEHGTEDLEPILRAADAWISDNYGQKLEFSRPFRGKRRLPTPGELKEEMSGHLAKPNTAVIVSTSEHWTVVQRATNKRVILFDSDGHTFFRLDKQKPTNAGRILLGQVFLLSLTHQ